MVVRDEHWEDLKFGKTKKNMTTKVGNSMDEDKVLRVAHSNKSGLVGDLNQTVVQDSKLPSVCKPSNKILSRVHRQSKTTNEIN